MAERKRHAHFRATEERDFKYINPIVQSCVKLLCHQVLRCIIREDRPTQYGMLDSSANRRFQLRNVIHVPCECELSVYNEEFA